MEEVAARRHDLHIAWGSVIAGSFIAIASTVVLGFFGAAFGAAGLGTLSGIWMTLTPLVCTFIGAVAAVTLAGRDGAYLNGVLVWCVSLIAGALLLAAGLTPGEASGSMIALGGLAGLLGLCGALAGSAVGTRLSVRGQSVEAGRAGYREAPREEVYRGSPTVPAGTTTERPEVRH